LGSQYIPPADEIEEQIAAIWREVLHLKQVGTQDDFFELGGHSLLIAQVISRMRESFKMELPASSLFDAPTIAALADGVRQDDGAGSTTPSLRSNSQAGMSIPPLSFAQRRLWFIDRLEPGSHAYNVPSAVQLEGTLNLDALQRSLNKIAQRHESLRTTIWFENGNLAQVITPEQPIKLPLVDLRKMPMPGRADSGEKVVDDEARRPFDLERGPVVAVYPLCGWMSGSISCWW